MGTPGILRRCEARPTAVIGGLAVVCLLAFLVTIPLPRVDGQLLGADGFGYFVYLPSVVIDHDLDLTNQYATLLPHGPIPSTERTSTGLLANPWPVGAALLWLPFFLLAHVLAIGLHGLGAGIRLDGCGYWYQTFVIAGNIGYGGAALLMAYGVAHRVSAPASALWATVLVGFAGNLVYYLTAEASMAHAVSAFAVSLFFLAWMRMRGRPGIMPAAALGACVGLIALVRQQDVLLATVPLGGHLIGCWRAGHAQRARLPVLSWFRDALVMGLAALLVYSPQMLVSHVIYGAWWSLPQLYASQWGDLPRFAWSSPHFIDVLVSARRGLLAWHPVFAIALLGIVPLWRHDRTFAAAVLLGVVAEAYLLGCWFDWWQGRAFGARAFISCLPLFTAALAALVDAGRRVLPSRPRAREIVVSAIGLVLVAANFLLFVEYRFDLVTRSTPASWHDLGTRRVTFALDSLRRLYRPFRPGTTSTLSIASPSRIASTTSNPRVTSAKIE
jgi:hypothetical protein